MKLLRIVTVLVFVAVITVPLFCFNTTADAVSLIDNRKLTENPFTLEGDLTVNIQNYINDRIGLRDEAINAYTQLNDKLFKKMVHPSYDYGKEGYVFGAGITTGGEFGDYHVAFADMVAKMQKYCQERNVPFLFVFNPAKPAVYSEYIAKGINYNREWVDQFFAELDQRGVRYLDNTQTMKAIREKGMEGFNQKYDANHWNDLGAFYGTQAILKRLQEQNQAVHVNEIEEFSVGEALKESLLVSKFPINEKVPALELKNSVSNRNDSYTAELELHPSYKAFGYYINEADYAKETPKALVFQGSYMNSYGYKYMQNAFREYVYVHDYQNVINLPYYFNIFQPECVVFEVAEYTFLEEYFSYESMVDINYNPVKTTEAQIDLKENELLADQGETLTTLTWKTDKAYPYVWIELDGIYDMQKIEGGYQVTIETARYQGAKDYIKIYA